MRKTILTTVLLGACLTGPEGRDDAFAYADRVEPLIYENGLLARALMSAAAESHNGDIEAEPLARWWHRDFTPLSEHLAHQAAAVSAPPAWSSSHRDLVEIWERRAEAYRALDVALSTGDAAGWAEARAKADEVKIEEEEWFRAADEQLAPFGLALDQYP